jgi:hypothetical protein
VSWRHRESLVASDPVRPACASFLESDKRRLRQAIGRARRDTARTTELDGLVLQPRDLGLSYQRIAEELEARLGRRVTRQAVHQRVRRLRLAAQGDLVPRWRA